ncbi:EthD family reductase [Geodermatophilus sabuli]|uniref:EthD family reductase n=1 Tax=Geodermatophilus sabuli TaxID=1564158 RepID=A0A7K3W4W0_9ACTN|nr:EthD family reductase [Geodermatophilus sabuli]
MHRLVVSYGQPDDPGTFDEYYRDTHAPLAMEIPGVVKFTVGHARSLDPAQQAPYLVVELDFESEEAMGKGLGSPEGQAASADVANFATGGATFAHFDVREVNAGMPYFP